MQILIILDICFSFLIYTADRHAKCARCLWQGVQANKAMNVVTACCVAINLVTSKWNLCSPILLSILWNCKLLHHITLNSSFLIEKNFIILSGNTLKIHRPPLLTGNHGAIERWSVTFKRKQFWKIYLYLDRTFLLN